MPARRLRTVLPALAVVGVLLGTGSAQATHDDAPRPGRWTAAWSAAPQRPSSGFGPNWSQEGFDNQTVRQTVRVTADGTSARIRLSNLYGASALTVTGATVAKTGDGAATVPGTTRDLTFQQGRQLVIPAGAKAASDPLPFPVRAMEEVTVTLYLAGTTGPATFHAQAFNSSYRATGDHRGDSTGDAFTQSSASWYYLSGVDVAGDPRRDGAVVAFGDSITDGFGSTVDANRRYTDALAERLAGAGTPRPVLNAGIGGNTVLNDSSWYGDKGIQRFARDVLGTPGVDTVLLLQGVNDIGFSETDQPTYKPAPVVSAQDLIAGYRNMIRKAHEHGVRIVGATLLPFGGSDHYGPHAAAVSNEVNDWIRSSREFDAVVDFDRALADPADPEKLSAAYDSGDHLHPNDAGYRAMADNIDLDVL